MKLCGKLELPIQTVKGQTFLSYLCLFCHFNLWHIHRHRVQPALVLLKALRRFPKHTLTIISCLLDPQTVYKIPTHQQSYLNIGICKNYKVLIAMPNMWHLKFSTFGQVKLRKLKEMLDASPFHERHHTDNVTSNETLVPYTKPSPYR